MPFGFVAAFVEARCKGRLALHPRVGKGVGSGRYGSWHVDEKGYSKVTRRLLRSHWAHLAGTLVQSRGETDDTAHMSWVLLHGMAQMYRSYAVAVTAARSCNLPQNSMAGVIVRLKQAQARRPTNIAQVHGLCMEDNAQSPSAEASGSLARSQSMLYCSANANQIHDHAQVSCLPQHSCTLQWFREGEEKQNERDYRLLTARAPRPSEAGIAPDVAHFIEKLRVRVRVCFGFGAHLL